MKRTIHIGNTEELGMVYADKNQVVTYDKTPTEYVRQNENITD